MYDGNATRIALVAILPPLVLTCAFPCSVFVSSLVRACLSGMKGNQLTGSAVDVRPNFAIPPEFGFL